MSQLPNSAKAIVDIKKLEGYCLNPYHQRGKHKARVFRNAIGFIKKDAKLLQNKLLDAVINNEAIEINADNFGTRYYIDFQIVNGNKKAMIRSIWILKSEEKFPRLITCYVK
ncbi:MAG: DUF6883 domain-containing protein [Ignavibacteriota bacterium]